mgnify:CR=1 FL=1
MSYIGYSHAANHIAPPHIREVLAPNGSATYFDLNNDVPGYHEENVTVVVNNVIQEPYASYTIINNAANQPRRLDFAGVALASTDSLYVIHQGTGTLYNTPAAGSVTKTSLASNLVSHVVDKFLGSQATSGNTQLSLSETPTNADAISVYVNGIYQRSGGANNYDISGSNLTFSSALTSTDQIDVHHHTFRSTTTKVADASVGTTQLANDAVTSAKLDTNLAIAGTLGVTGLLTATGNLVIPNAGNIGSVGDPDSLAIDASGNVTASQNLTVTGNFTVNGTTTTLDTTLMDVDKLEVGANSADHGASIVQAGNGIGLKVNSTGTGNLLEIQDAGTAKFVIADGGAATITGSLSVSTTLAVTTTSTFTGLMTANGGLDTDTNSKVKQKGAFMQSSTHQALCLGL